MAESEQEGDPTNRFNLKDKFLTKLQSLRGKPSRGGEVSPQYSQPSERDNISLLTQEPIPLQFPLMDYHYYREGLRQLMRWSSYDPETDGLQNLILPGESEESSSNIGSAGWSIAKGVVCQLREGRTDAEGQPYIICVDEVSDSAVLNRATESDRQEAIRKVISGQLTRFNRPIDRFTTGGVAVAAVLTGREIGDTRDLILQAEELSKIDPSKKSEFVLALQNLDVARVEKLLSFVKGSKARLIQEDKQYTYKHGPRKYASFEDAYIASIETGEPLFSLGGSEFKAPSEHNQYIPVTLNSQEVQVVESLRAVVHRSRENMARQARLFAVKYLDLDPNRKHSTNPPDWWMNDEKLEGIRSDEVLIYIPHSRRSTDEYPPFLKGYESGWYLFRLPYDSNNNVIVKFVSKFS